MTAQSPALFSKTTYTAISIMRSGSNSVAYIAGVVISIAVFMTESVELVAVSFWLLVISTLICTKICDYKSIFQMSWLGSHYTFCMMPMTLLYASGGQPVFTAVAICNIFLYIVLWLSDGAEWTLKFEYSRNAVVFFVVYSVFFVACLVVLGGNSVLYTVPGLVVLFAWSIGGASATVSLILFGFYSFVIALYAVLFWSGFGRSALAGYVFAPMLLLCYRLGLRISKLAIFISMSFAGIAGSVIRNNFTDIGALVSTSLQDSASSPVILAQDIIDTEGPWGGRGVAGLFDQYVLFLLGPAPRAWWPQKPIGFGFQYTLDNLDYYLVLAGHSIAALYVGEHIYYVGYVFSMISVLVSLVLFIYFYKFLCKMRVMHGSIGIALVIYIPSFYWGGMSAFSTRFFLGVIPLALFYVGVSLYRRMRSATYSLDRSRG